MLRIGKSGLMIINNLPQGGDDVEKIYIIEKGKLNSDIGTKFVGSPRIEANCDGGFGYEEALQALVLRKNGGSGQKYRYIRDLSFELNVRASDFACVELIFSNDGNGSFPFVFDFEDYLHMKIAQDTDGNKSDETTLIRKGHTKYNTTLKNLHLDLWHENMNGYFAIKNIWIERS